MKIFKKIKVTFYELLYMTFEVILIKIKYLCIYDISIHTNIFQMNLLKFL